jgi:hypothetical protein
MKTQQYCNGHCVAEIPIMKKTIKLTEEEKLEIREELEKGIDVDKFMNVTIDIEKEVKGNVEMFHCTGRDDFEILATFIRATYTVLLNK